MLITAIYFSVSAIITLVAAAILWFNTRGTNESIVGAVFLVAFLSLFWLPIVALLVGVVIFFSEDEPCSS